jgi:hypothetical protein
MAAEVLTDDYQPGLIAHGILQRFADGIAVN